RSNQLPPKQGRPDRQGFRLLDLRRSFCVDLVEHDSHERLFSKSPPCFSHYVKWSGVGAHHEQNTIATVGQQTGIGNRNRGRRIDNDPIKQRFHLINKELQTTVCHELGVILLHGASTGNQKEVICAASLHNFQLVGPVL